MSFDLCYEAGLGVWTDLRVLVHSLVQKVSAFSVVGSVPGAGDNTVNKTKALL